MKKSLTIVLALFVVALFVISTAVAGEEKKPEEKPVQTSGAVKVTKDADGKMAVKVGETQVAADDMGKDLAALMDGKRTMVKGVVTDKVLAVRVFSITEVVGKVEVTKADNKVESAKIVMAAGPAFVVDKKSLEEAAKMDGKNVEVSGVVALKEGAKILTIQGALKPAPEKKADK